jgi:hypothetical protein
MNKEEIYNNNKIIAQFMGWKPDERHGSINDNELDVWSNNKNSYKFCDLTFHKDWSLLMPVVEKIESGIDSGFSVVIKNDKCRIYRYKNSPYEKAVTELYEGVSKIESTYLAIIDFIKYFNQNFSEEVKNHLLK